MTEIQALTTESTVRNHLGLALLRANILYLLYERRAPRMVERFWAMVEAADENIEEINLACDAIMLKLAPKALERVLHPPIKKGRCYHKGHLEFIYGKDSQYALCSSTLGGCGDRVVFRRGKWVRG